MERKIVMQKRNSDKNHKAANGPDNMLVTNFTDFPLNNDLKYKNEACTKKN